MKSQWVCGPADNDPKEGAPMAAAIVLIVLALLIGGVGLAVSALKWMLIIAAVLFLVGIIAGFGGRRRTV